MRRQQSRAGGGKQTRIAQASVNACCDGAPPMVESGPPSMKASRFVLAGLLLAAGRLLSVSASAETILAPPFTDHAVLQRDTAVPVWGWDSPAGGTVTITYDGQTKETRVNQSGLWR